MTGEAPRVWHLRDSNCPPEAVYIGRGTPYGNPFWEGSRERRIADYEKLVLSQPELVAYIKKNLKGKHLKCHCFPQACHGDVLIAIANS